MQNCHPHQNIVLIFTKKKTKQTNKKNKKPNKQKTIHLPKRNSKAIDELQYRITVQTITL
jgi:hypothetical protein